MSQIERIAGVSFILPIKFLKGTAPQSPGYPIGGYTFVLSVMQDCKNKAAFTLSSADGAITNDGVSTIFITFSEATTENLTPGLYKMQIIGTSGDGVPNIGLDLDDLKILRRIK